ncbi:hypothetical protein HK103_000470 [Boothiomyces macroporosus]|uniref:Endoplasmic oxidoreductin-1 n=1 Tax=Boothiomyces macroporosus TaxID=261099 RepID=A0AAD5UCD8_9FUNG|nr:hypothetical protein HK103_000470 [Boothiomyces macroporosus]
MKPVLFLGAALAQGFTQATVTCPKDAIISTNNELLPILNQLVKTSVFRYYKANLHKECKFWREDQLCNLKDCTVYEAQEDEIPTEWKKEALSFVDYSPSQSFQFIKKCQDIDESDFCVLEDQSDIDGVYINLLKNQERYSGYAGESAARVWSSIYNENCFDVTSNPLTLQDTCLEKQTFFKLISGLHTSISLHICNEWLDRTTGNWVKNQDCYKYRVGNHPERIENLNFIWAVMVRAVSKLTPYLANHPFCNGSGDEAIVVKNVDKVIEAVNSCPTTFDETILFANEYETLKNDFKMQFRNISEIMDCVGCEKCRLWGKIQITGLGTALKVFPKYYKLTRAELVALMNAFHRLSESIQIVQDFQSMEKRKIIDHSENKVLDEEQFIKHMQFDGFVRGYTWYAGFVALLYGIYVVIKKGIQMERLHAKGERSEEAKIRLQEQQPKKKLGKKKHKTE